MPFLQTRQRAKPRKIYSSVKSESLIDCNREVVSNGRSNRMAGTSSRAATGEFLSPAIWAGRINVSQRQWTSFLRLVRFEIAFAVLVFLTATAPYRSLKTLPARLMVTETQTQMKMTSKRKSGKKSKA